MIFLYLAAAYFVICIALSGGAAIVLSAANTLNPQRPRPNGIDETGPRTPLQRCHDAAQAFRAQRR